MLEEDLNFKFAPADAIEDQVTVKRLSAMLAAIRRAQPPQHVRGGRITQTDTGWELTVNPAPSGANGWRPLTLVETSEGDVRKVRWTYGLINGLVVPGVDTDVEISSQDWVYFFADAVTSPGSPRLVTDVSIITGEAADEYQIADFEEDGAPPPNLYYLLARAKLSAPVDEGGALIIENYGGGNVEFSVYTGNYQFSDTGVMTVVNRISVLRTG